ncbi:MAG: hypothetical protein H6672_00690 [Anaerolineaceae bacterium]|nr:hypothetical protein [Anaerolineaceae bacterium]
MDIQKHSIRLYRALLCLYPAAHRRAYGDLMTQTFRDGQRDACLQGRMALVGWWWRTVGDMIRTVPAEHLAGRKVGLMDSALFKNHPGRAASLLFLLPGIFLSLYYFTMIDTGQNDGYFMAALAGIIGFALGRLKIIPQTHPWGHFALGFVFGAVSFMFFIIWSPGANLGIPALRQSPWPEIRQWVAIGVSLLLIGGMGRLVHAPSRRLYWMVAGVLLVIGAVEAALYPGLQITWTWSSSATILSVVVLSLRLARRAGIQALLTVLVGFGIIQVINLMDITEAKTTFGQLSLFLAYLFPLAICPAWLLLAPTWKGKKRGVLLSWSAMLAGLVVILPILDGVFVQHYFRHPIIVVLPSAFTSAPLLIGLWLAFTLYERQSMQPTTTSDSPLHPARMKS